MYIFSFIYGNKLYINYGLRHVTTRVARVKAPSDIIKNTYHNIFHLLTLDIYGDATEGKPVCKLSGTFSFHFKGFLHPICRTSGIVFHYTKYT